MKNLSNSNIVLLKYTGSLDPKTLTETLKNIIKTLHYGTKGLIKTQDKKVKIWYQFINNNNGFLNIGINLSTDFSFPNSWETNIKVVENRETWTPLSNKKLRYLDQLKTFLSQKEYFTKNNEKLELEGTNLAFYSSSLKDELTISLSNPKTKSEIDMITSDIRDFLYDNYTIGNRSEILKINFIVSSNNGDKTLFIRWISSKTEEVSDALYVTTYKKRLIISKYFAQSMFKGIETKYGIKYVGFRRGRNTSSNRYKLESSFLNTVYLNELFYFSPPMFYFLKEVNNVDEAKEFFEKNRTSIENDVIKIFESFGSWKTKKQLRQWVYTFFTYKLIGSNEIYGLPKGKTRYLWEGEVIKTTKKEIGKYEKLPGSFKTYTYEKNARTKDLENFKMEKSYANSILFHNNFVVNNNVYKIKNVNFDNSTLTLNIDQLDDNNAIIPCDLSINDAGLLLKKIFNYMDYDYDLQNSLDWTINLKTNDGKGTYTMKIGHSFHVQKSYTWIVTNNKTTLSKESLDNLFKLVMIKTLDKKTIPFQSTLIDNSYLIKISQLNQEQLKLLFKSFKAYVFQYMESLLDSKPITISIAKYDSSQYQGDPTTLQFKTNESKLAFNLLNLKTWFKNSQITTLLNETDFQFATIRKSGSSFEINFRKKDDVSQITENSIDTFHNKLEKIFGILTQNFQLLVNFNYEDPFNPKSSLDLNLNLFDSFDSFDMPIGNNYAKFNANISLTAITIKRKLEFLVQVEQAIKEIISHNSFYDGLEFGGFEKNQNRHLRIIYDTNLINHDIALVKIRKLLDYLVTSKKIDIVPNIINYFVLIPKKMEKYISGSYNYNSLFPNDSIIQKDKTNYFVKFVSTQKFSRGINELTINKLYYTKNGKTYALKKPITITDIGLEKNDQKITLALIDSTSQSSTSIELTYSISVELTTYGNTAIVFTFKNVASDDKLEKLDIYKVKWKLLGQYLIVMKVNADGQLSLEHDYDKNWVTLYLLNKLATNAFKVPSFFNYLQVETFDINPNKYEKDVITLRLQEDLNDNSLRNRNKILKIIIEYLSGKRFSSAINDPYVLNGKELVNSYDDLYSDHMGTTDKITFNLWSRDFSTVTTLQLSTNWINWGNANAKYIIQS